MLVKFEVPTILRTRIGTSPGTREVVEDYMRQALAASLFDYSSVIRVELNITSVKLRPRASYTIFCTNFDCHLEHLLGLPFSMQALNASMNE